MPEPKILHLGANQLVEGDWLYLGDEAVVVNGRPEVKHKYAYVPVEGRDRPLRLALDVNQRISRLVPTEEESVAQRLAFTISAITARHATLTELVKDYHQKLIDNLDMLDASWHGRYWASYAEAQYELGLWNKVFKIAENREVNLSEALDLFVDHLRTEFIRRGNFSPRSTSMISNFCETMQNDVTARFIRDHEMFGF